MEYSDQSVAKFLWRNFCPCLRSIKFRVLVTPLIVFTLEDLYGLTVSESDEDICLKVDTSKDKDAHELWKMLYAWKEQADKLSSEEISKDKYDEGRYHTENKEK